MCELHPFRCTTCGVRWLVHKKLASCNSTEAEAWCPESLCMYVGSPRRPQRGECEACASIREMVEDGMEDAAGANDIGGDGGLLLAAGRASGEGGNSGLGL